MAQIVEPLLGTRAEVAATATHAARARAAEAAVLAEVARLEAIFSVFDPSSALHDLRRTGSTDVPELLTVMETADRWQERTAGAFHPRAQPLVDLWDQAEQAGVAPTAARLRETVSNLDKTGSSKSNSTVDLNAIAKGWIADHAVTAAVDGGSSVDAVWLSLGGDVMHRGTGRIVVGIEDPKRPYDNVEPLATVELSNEALATSGRARRWWTIGGQRYAKIIDARSGYPSERVASATIIAPEGSTADALATTALVLSTSELLDLVAEASASCLLIHHDGSRTSTGDRFRAT